MDYRTKKLIQMGVLLGCVLFWYGLLRVLMGCSSINNALNEMVTTTTTTTVTTTTMKPVVHKCDGAPYSVVTKNQGTVHFPASGKMVEESHYQTQEDVKRHPAWPTEAHQDIQEHLARSCVIYQRYDPNMPCDKLYHQSWQLVWTPSEGGKVGQGSSGNFRPPAENEMWQGNMQLSKNFPLATRLLAQANGKSVVLYMGNEIGPSDAKWLGGMSGEAHHWLGTSNGSTIKLTYLKDQTLPFGPVNCQ